MGDSKRCQHMERHCILNSYLDELVACFLNQHAGVQQAMTGKFKSLSNTTVLEFMQWSGAMARADKDQPELEEGDTGH